jgi:uncharacterized membrane protein
MPDCNVCQNPVDSGTTFCPVCGQPQSGGAVVQAQPTTQPGLPENIAGAACYVLGWITGIVFLIIDHRPSVRFHAKQSIMVFGGFTAIVFVLNIISASAMRIMGAWVVSFTGFLDILIDIVAFVVWILLIVKAIQGEKFSLLPEVSRIAQNYTRK